MKCPFTHVSKLSTGILKACWFHSWGVSCHPRPCLHLQVPSCLSESIPIVKQIHISLSGSPLSHSKRILGMYPPPHYGTSSLLARQEPKVSKYTLITSSPEPRHEARDEWCAGSHKTQTSRSQNQGVRKVSVQQAQPRQTQSSRIFDDSNQAGHLSLVDSR